MHADLKKVQEENSQLHEANVSGSIERNKAHQVELLNVRNELTSVRSQLKQAEEKYATEVSATIKQLENELDQQKMKNNVSFYFRRFIVFYEILQFRNCDKRTGK